MKRFALQAGTLLVLFTIVFATGKIKAQNSGPIAPEAASFEPVDATDMVNLVTGDFSYVLPLLEVPSPEGGYPIALSYHAGITMDQEASWVGLGWNVNPGAINRSVNGYPDDWKDKSFSTIQYDNGGSEEQYSFSVGIGISEVVSVGLNYSWGSQKAFGGYVSLGPRNTPFSVTFSASTRGVSVGVGFSAHMMNLGVSMGPGGISSSLSAGMHRNIGNKNGIHTGAGASVGISLSSNGMGAGVDVLGVSASLSAMDGISLGDYTIRKSSTYIPFLIGSYSHEKVTWWLFLMKEKFCSGSIYIENARENISGSENWGLQSHDYKMDVNESPYSNNYWEDFSDYANKYNTLMFPAYDNYQVNAQGLGGSITPRLLEAGVLVGDARDIKKDNDGNVEEELTYYFFPNDTRESFDKTPAEIYFEFNYANNSYLRVEPANWERVRPDMDVLGDWGNNGGTLDITNDLGQSNYNAAKKRRKTGSYVEWITNADIYNGERLTERGFLQPDGIPNGARGAIDFFNPDGIGAILITTEDGKTYHYSIPVYLKSVKKLITIKLIQANFEGLKYFPLFF